MPRPEHWELMLANRVTLVFAVDGLRLLPVFMEATVRSAKFWGHWGLRVCSSAATLTIRAQIPETVA